MFSSLLVEEGITLTEIALCSASAIVCGLIIALAYRSASHPSRSFSLTMAVLPMIVMVVILMVNGNLGVGVAVAGSFSLVRFRSLPGKASDIAVVFFSMAAGLACGTGYATFALASTIAITLIALVLVKTNVFSQPGNLRYLTITIPEDLNYAEAFRDIFADFTKHAQLSSLKTVNLGALYELRYEVTLKDQAREKELLDAIRTRNGNLTVMSSLMAPLSTEL